MKIIAYDNNPGPRLFDKFLLICWMTWAYIRKWTFSADQVFGISSPQELNLKLKSFNWVETFEYWGHGSRGTVWINSKPYNALDIAEAFKDVRTFSSTLIWFRACNVFSGTQGHAFAIVLARSIGCIVAGHTKIVGFFQPGLRILMNGGKPKWPVDENDGKVTLLTSLGLVTDENTVGFWAVPNTVFRILNSD